jgi:tRNA (guanine-N7-)-methyltransferase
MSSEPGALRTYGRVKTRSLKPRQARLLETLAPSLALPETAFDPLAIMPAAAEVWLEAGFGAGEHLATQAARRPDVLLIGAEPFLNGFAAGVAHVCDQALANVRLHHGDVRWVMAQLPDASIDRLYILFPDPWPKTRHKKRRLVEPAFIAEAARVMKPGAMLHFATDWADYADWTLERMLAAPAFRWTAEAADDWGTPPADHAATRYELKRLGDCAPIWLEFERV